MIQNSKWLPYVTWVTPNVRKEMQKWKKNPCFVFNHLFLELDFIFEHQVQTFQKYKKKTLKKSINLVFFTVTDF